MVKVYNNVKFYNDCWSSYVCYYKTNEYKYLVLIDHNSDADRLIRVHKSQWHKEEIADYEEAYWDFDMQAEYLS